MTDLNPQREQMADESMVRNLEAQANAIWPQEASLYQRYGLSPGIDILDAGCGTGEGASRLAELYPKSKVLGVDVLDHHLELARNRYAPLASRVRFENRSIYELGLPDASFDLTVCRHVLHSIPYVEAVVAELARVTRPGGWLHLIPEDYGMLHFEKGGQVDPDEFWWEVPKLFGEKTKTDLYIGRNIYTILVALGLESIAIDYIIVDTLRVPRETFAAIITAWRDGYAALSAEFSRYSVKETTAYFNQMIETILDPKQYAVWMVPVVGARVPKGAGWA
ncbi:MAG TPA: methyltransferase domain-containing protein [Tepidiformaceae bacterium]|nr:methyltransferase domain-containing protein [Tepidiformaceae bacterium]